jgi:DNA-binding beta-propeller fold protein YncE
LFAVPGQTEKSLVVQENSFMASIHRTLVMLAACFCCSCSYSWFDFDAPTPPPLLMPRPASGTYAVSEVLRVGGEGRWDYVAIDPRSKILYVPRQTHTQMILATTGQVITDVPNTPGVHGVALVPELHRAFASNGQGNSVTVFDLDSGRVLGAIAAGEKPDAIIYDPASQRVLAFNGKSSNVTVIDPRQDPKSAITWSIQLDGAPESAVSDHLGHVYVNLEDQNAVEVIDTRAMAVIDVWKIEGGEAPTGIALDPVRNRLYCGCHNRVMAVLDIGTGKTLATLPIGKGVDACEFDAVTGKAFASCGDGTLTIARETTPGTFEVIQTVATRPGARTMTLDPLTHKIYLPTAEFVQATTQRNGRPEVKPGSFMIVVVSPIGK